MMLTKNKLAEAAYDAGNQIESDVGPLDPETRKLLYTAFFMGVKAAVEIIKDLDTKT